MPGPVVLPYQIVAMGKPKCGNVFPSNTIQIHSTQRAKTSAIALSPLTYSE
jgi:hypothetical protein